MPTVGLSDGNVESGVDESTGGQIRDETHVCVADGAAISKRKEAKSKNISDRQQIQRNRAAGWFAN